MQKKKKKIKTEVQDLQKNKLNKLVLHPKFKSTIKDLNKVNITLIGSPTPIEVDFSSFSFSNNPSFGIIGRKVKKVKLDALNGLKNCANIPIVGYDESKLRYQSLEGDAFFTAHSLVVHQDQDYLPINYLSFYFYTRSTKLKNLHKDFSLSDDPNSDSNRHYVEDRNSLLLNYPINNALYFIDGPLIGGNISSYTVKLVKELHNSNIKPFFFVKNSDSNIVTDNIEELKKEYNSDMHWSFKFLPKGYRTNFFTYVDQHNKENSKVFCYLKAFNRSPQRIEFHFETYQRIADQLNDLMDIIYYLLIVNGDQKNPQIRPIAIAEMYAREVLKLSDSYRLIKYSGLIPTMNQQRFGN